MEDDKKVPSLPEHQPQNSLFGAPPLIPGEDLAAYKEFEMRVAKSVKPADFLEEIWVRDVVDLTWEILRLRRLKAAFLTVVQPEGLKGVLSERFGLQSFDRAQELADLWALRDPEAMQEVETLLAAKGLTMDNAIARALAVNIDPFGRMDSVVMNLEARRNAAIRELGRHRASAAQALRRTTNDVIDAEFADVGIVPSVQ